MALLFDINQQKTRQETLTYSPNSSVQSTVQYAPVSNYSPSVSVVYPAYNVQLNSPFASQSGQSKAAAVADPSVNPSAGQGVSAEQKPSVITKPESVSGGGIDPTLLIAGAVVLGIVGIYIMTR